VSRGVSEVLLGFVFIGLGSVAGVLMRGREPLYIL